MEPDNPTDWLASAVEQFERHGNRSDGDRVVRCLASGLSMLRDSLYERIHWDVEQALGRDSMLMPVSEIKSRKRTIQEIETYQTAEAAATATGSKYVAEGDEWFGPWLARMRSMQSGLGLEIRDAWRNYFDRDSDDRRHIFMDRLGQIMPESRRAPLVLFRLVPLAIQIATASAFGDGPGAAHLRQEQTTILPAVADCQQCRGQVLECVDQCRACGNPLWKHEWLIATD